MYYKLNDNELEKINSASKITMTDYELLGNFVPVESMIAIIEDLLCEVGRLEEKYEDLERDLEDNYIHRPMSDYTGDMYDDRF